MLVVELWCEEPGCGPRAGLQEVGPTFGWMSNCTRVPFNLRYPWHPLFMKSLQLCKLEFSWGGGRKEGGETGMLIFNSVA